MAPALALLYNKRMSQPLPLQRFYLGPKPPTLEGLPDAMAASSPEEIGLALSWAVDRGDEALALALLKAPCPPENYNFALQSACAQGHEALARALLPLSSIISVSRSLKKAAFGESPACLRMLIDRLDAEGGWIPYDNAIALRDASTAHNPECLRLLVEKSCPDALSWALREHALAGQARAIRVLCRAGADLDRLPPWPPVAGSLWKNRSARQCFEMKRAMGAFDTEPAELEALSLDLELSPHLASAKPPAHRV